MTHHSHPQLHNKESPQNRIFRQVCHQGQAARPFSDTATMATIRLFFLLLLLSLCVEADHEDIQLIQFKDSLANSASLDSTWVKGTNPCDKQKPWEGIDCSETGNTAVSSILLMSHGLAGDATSIDIKSLLNLQSLRFLSLENNSFSGPLPGFNRLTSLKSLFLGGNKFSGDIPPGYFDNTRSLKRIHLSRNMFTGNIPVSLAKLNSLREVLLQQNDFSGPIPSFETKSLEQIDLSNNRLQGEIPQSLSKFPAAAFAGNPDLCGSVISKPCMAPGASATVHSDTSNLATKWAILGIVVTLLLVTILFKAKKREPSFRVIGKENMDEQTVSVRAPSLNRRVGSARKSNISDIESQSSKKQQQGGKATNELVMINDEKGAFRLPDLMKAAAEVLGSGGLGSAYKATMTNGLSVVVKRMRHMNKLSRDAFDVEVRKLGRIRHRNILPPLAYHYRKEEKLLVTEHMPTGSLSVLLHGNSPGDRSAEQSELSWAGRVKIIKGIARGMGFLHTEFSNHELPHGNLKSSNVLLTPNHEPLLTDYALYQLISNVQSTQALSASKSPEFSLYQVLNPKSDVYCLGIIILEIMTRKFPAQYVSNQKGGTDVVQWVRQAIAEGRLTELIDPELTSSSNESIDQMEKMLRIGATFTENDHEQRIEMREAIRSIEEIQS